MKAVPFIQLLVRCCLVVEASGFVLLRTANDSTLFLQKEIVLHTQDLVTIHYTSSAYDIAIYIIYLMIISYFLLGGGQKCVCAGEGWLRNSVGGVSLI